MRGLSELWFVFPQLRGLGSSSLSLYYGLDGINEARQYFQKRYLLDNYLELCLVLLNLKTSDSKEVFGEIDAMKFHSSLTLASIVCASDLITKLLQKYFAGKKDEKTIELLNVEG